MFYIASKLFWMVAQPLSLIFFSLVLGFAFAVFRLRRTSCLALGFGVVFGFVAIFTNLGELVVSPLEQLYHRPATIPGDTYGAIILGGAIDAALAKTYESYELNAAGDRLVEAMRLAHVDPSLRILVTGGVGELSQDGDGDGVAAQRMFAAFGFDSKRFLYETKSRSTFENAVNSRAMLGAEAEKKWLLVTSAFHMPRAVAVFKAQGFDVVPWPVDYRAPPHPNWHVDFENGLAHLSVLTLGVHEWAGLGAYWMSGKIKHFWP